MLEVQPPAGSFTPDLARPASTCCIAAGSGITPVLSIAASLLAAHDETVVTLIYGNRRSDTVMFADEIADLKDAHPARLRVVHVLSREPHEVELFSGRLDAAKLRDLLPSRSTSTGVDHWWLCGPFGMVNDAIGVLRELGVGPERIHRELFFVGEQPNEVHHADAPVGAGATVTVVHGRPTEHCRRPGGDHRPRRRSSRSAPTCRSPARAACAAPAGPASPTARCGCAATSPSIPTRSTPATC